MVSLLLKVLALGGLPGAQSRKVTSLYDVLMAKPTEFKGLTASFDLTSSRGAAPGLWAELSLSNLRDKDIVFDNRLGFHANVFLYVFNQKREVVPYADWTARVFYVAPQRASDLTALKPGTTYRRRGLFDSVQLSPGIYTVIAVYEEWDGRGKSPFAGKFWQGEVRSRPTPINVVR